MRDDEGDYWDEDETGSISCDNDWAGSIAKVMAKAYPLQKGTTLRVGVLHSHDPMLGGKGHVIAPCAERHVHYCVSLEMPLVGVNITLVYAYALACAFDEIDWAEAMPPWESVNAWLLRLCEVIDKVNESLARAIRSDVHRSMFRQHWEGMSSLPATPESDAAVELARNRKLVN